MQLDEIYMVGVSQNFKTQKPLVTPGTVCRGTCIAVEC